MLPGPKQFLTHFSLQAFIYSVLQQDQDRMPILVWHLTARAQVHLKMSSYKQSIPGVRLSGSFSEGKEEGASLLT